MKNDDNTPSRSVEIYKRLFPFVRPYRMRLVVGIVCGILQGGATFGMLVALRWALGGISGDDLSLSGLPALDEPEGSTGGIGLNRLLLAVSILPLFTILQGILFFAGKYFVEWVGNRVITDLRSHLFEHIHALPMQFFSKNRVGELISRITSDTGLLTQLVSNVIGDIIREPFTLIGCIAALIYLDWHLSIVALVVFPICILPVALLGRKVRKASKVGQESLGDMLSVVQESIGGALVVKAFQMEKEETRRFNIFNTKVFKMVMRQSRARSLNEPIMVFFSSIGLSGVVVYAYLNDLSLALLFSFGAAMVTMYKPAKKLSQIHLRIQRATPGAERIFEILDVVNTIDDAPDAVPFTGQVQSVDFKDVSFAYDEKKILDGINLQTQAGQCIAFVGSSGAGKTTIVNLIPRFFDVTEGCIKLNGRDIRAYTVHSLREQIGIVTQETVLFNRSVADNISYGSRDATPEQIEDAARRANAHAFIQELENGYDTVIGERGSLLSGGMAQRVAIARALLKNPPILILDEATSALDTESERLVQGALDELMKDRTVFMIAHRLSTIAHADLIVVLEQGKIVEQGTHEELLEKGGKYKYFYDIQFTNT
ncbi:MAG: ABC transporter ATP-binding protein [Verrucomicrobia bacterium]|nr:ABC transporter ATP-binding protein [Verrucomicrobiota bacterium]